MAPTIAAKTDVYFLAEAPGQHEDETSGRPLTGPSGKLLRECIPEGQAKYCSFDNVVRDRPENNRTPTWQEIECCRGHVTKSIEQAKPKLIVGLGAVPLSWMLNSTDMAGMRGRLFVVKVGTHTCYFLPTYHPSFILRVAYDKRKPLNSKMGLCFRFDINRAFDLVPTLDSPVCDSPSSIRSGIHAFDGSEAVQYPNLLSLLEVASLATTKAIDLETKGLRPYAKDAAIMTAAVSHGNVNFSFAIDHPNAKWTPKQLVKILELFEKLLRDDTIKVAHNAPFELEWLIWLFGKEVVNHDVWHDSMVQAHILDERRGKQGKGDADSRRAVYQGLDFLVKQHFGITYKSTFKLNKKDMSKSDLGETLIYNGVDTKYTLGLFHKQEKLLKEQGLYDAYLEAIPRQASVALMQHLGIDVNQVEVKRIQGKLAGEIKSIEQEIASLKVVQAYVADHKEFNPAGAEVLTVFKDYLKCPEVAVKEKSGKIRYSVDKNVLDQIKHPLAPLIIRHRNRCKLKSTYCDGLELGVGTTIWPDGKLHTNFNTTFAETGRTSSDEPNQQNWPQRKDAWVRAQVEAPDGHVLLAFDYGQLEGCTAAMCSKDKALVDALWRDYDIHMEWSLKLAERYPQAKHEGETPKAFRSRVKNKLTFPAIFGAQNESIAGYLDIPVEPVDDLMKEFWRTFSGLKKWQDDLMQFYYKNGYVSSPTERRHRYPLTRNEAINFPIQSFACDIVCDAMNELSRIAVIENQWHLHPILNIHDDLTAIVPDNDAVLEEAIKVIYTIMLTPPYGSIINVPLSVSASIGKSWYGMTEIGKFWSHRDI